MDKGGEGVGAEEELGGFAEVVGGGAGLERGDAVVLRAEGYEGADGDGAGLEQAAEELAALGEAEGVEGGRRGKDGVGGNVEADFGYLFGEIAED